MRPSKSGWSKGSGRLVFLSFSTCFHLLQGDVSLDGARVLAVSFFALSPVVKGEVRVRKAMRMDG